MGSFVRATCECGYEHEFAIGGGMRDFLEVCLFPCLCRDCKRIVQVNLLDTPLSCSNCRSHNVVPYDHDELCEEQGLSDITSWSVERVGRELRLTDGRYHCPACASFRLRFQEGNICWD